MKKPAILAAIDAALVTHLPGGIRAAAEGHIISDVQDYLRIAGQRMTEYKAVRIARSLAQIEGDWAVQTRAGHERPARGGKAASNG